MLPPPVEDGPFMDLANTSAGKMPPVLLAPRYSHLLHEARSISGSPQSSIHSPEESSQVEKDDVDQFEEEEVERQSLFDDDNSFEEDNSYSDSAPAAPNGLGGRMKGFIMSYLPTLANKKPTGSSKLPKPVRPGLPLPPKDLINKPRGPVVTPARPPAPKAPAPKELVQLNAVTPVPEKKSSLPRPVGRLVELNHVPPKPEPEFVPRPRRSSGASVKDLVQSFESMEKNSTYPKSGSLNELKRVRSIGEGMKNAKPAWR
jgi:hypothetical protein